MTYFRGNGNQLTTFPIQPNMKKFYANNNQLSYIPSQPKLIEFSANNNLKLITIILND